MRPGANCLLVSGAIVGVIVSVLMGCFPIIYNSIVDNNLMLKDGSAIMDSFTQPPIPVYMKFYLFNVTNPMQIQYYGETPELVEVGPYVYEEVMHKIDEKFDSSGDNINYRENRTYHFRPEMSCGPESDSVITLNVVFVMMAALLHDHEHIDLIWPEMERTMDVFHSYNVSEILFHGAELPKFNFNFAETQIPKLKNLTYQGSLYEILLDLGVESDSIPDPIVENRIGYLSLANYTDDGLYKVSTGKKDMTEYLTIREWNEQTELSFWNDSYCDMINGTDGTQFPPRQINDETVVRIFISELCRSLYLTYEYDFKFYGISTLRFIPPVEVFQAPDLNPDNLCYCSTLGCLGSGFLELTPCLHIPVVMSPPHFYQGDENELKKFHGMHPNKSLHETILDVETTFGVPVSAHKRMQLNLPLRRYGDLPSFMNFEDLIFPVFWADETATLSEDDANTMKEALNLPYILVYTIGGVILIGCLVMIVVGLKRRRDMKSNFV